MLELVFITSNRVKLAHIRHLCREYDVVVSQQKNYGVGYDEPQVDDREELLARSIENAYKRWSISTSSYRDKLFFIEDTSVDIPALRTVGEFPGVNVKYWMRSNSFEMVNKDLLAKGNNRQAVVRSDIVLYLSRELQHIENGPKTLQFTSQQSGSIVAHEQLIKIQPLYPWLDNKTFNKWFIPDGCDRSISLLPISEAEAHDFRAGAVHEMLAYLSRRGLIKKRRTRDVYTSRIVQNNLFGESLLFVITGPSCAGKTTLAQYLANNHSYYHIEASDFMYASYYATHGVGSEVEVGDFAAEALIANPLIVVDQIVRHLININIPTVITGFRSPLEVIGLEAQYLGNQRTKAIYLDALADLRFKRSLRRNRSDARRTREKFDERDNLQMSMGLREIPSLPHNTTVRNNQTLRRLYFSFERRYHESLRYFPSQSSIVQFVHHPIHDLEGAIIVALLLNANTGKYFTTTEIANLINEEMLNPNSNIRRTIVSKNNVSRYFNQYFYPFYEIVIQNGRRKYRLTQTGVSQGKCLIQNSYKTWDGSLSHHSAQSSRQSLAFDFD